MKEKLTLKYDKEDYDYDFLERYNFSQLKALVLLCNASYYSCSEFWNNPTYTEFFNDSHFIIKDVNKNIVYAGCFIVHEWMEQVEDLIEHLDETNSCILSWQNFDFFLKEWKQLAIAATPFALLYRDDSNWVHLKQFNSEKEMHLFIKQNNSIWQQFKFWIQLKKNEWAWKLRHKIYKLKDLIRK